MKCPREAHDALSGGKLPQARIAGRERDELGSSHVQRGNFFGREDPVIGEKSGQHLFARYRSSFRSRSGESQT